MDSLKLEKGMVLEISMPNDITVKAVVVKEKIHAFESDCMFFSLFYHLCYSQNRLFLISEKYYPQEWMEDPETGDDFTIPSQSEYKMGEIIVDYCVIPEYDSIINSSECAERMSVD